jgi:hypothetical protein
MILFVYRILAALGLVGAPATTCVKKTDSILAGLIVLPLADMADAHEEIPG